MAGRTDAAATRGEGEWHRDTKQEIDRHYLALTALDHVTGLSYRGAISELVGLEAAGSWIVVPRLRQIIGQLGFGELSALEESCGPLARLWLPSNYEGSLLSALRQFAVEDGTEDLVRADLTVLLEREQHCQALAAHAEPGYETDAPEAVRAWLAQESATFEALDGQIRTRLIDWLELFRPASGGFCVGDALVGELKALSTDLDKLDSAGQDATLFEALAAKSDGELETAAADLAAWTVKPSLFGRLENRPGCGCGAVCTRLPRGTVFNWPRHRYGAFWPSGTSWRFGRSAPGSRLSRQRLASLAFRPCRTSRPSIVW